MRIAIPVAGETVASPLGDAEGFRFYEDDHGRIVRQFLVPMEERSTKAAIVSDPNNHCNACGFKGACSLKDKGGCGK